MEEKKKSRFMKVGLASICLAMATPLVFAGCAAEPEKGEKGDTGASAYEVARANGFTGTEAEWLASLQGQQGASAYEVAKANGFTGSEEEWLASLKGDEGDSAYEVAKANGFTGTEAEWLASLKGAEGSQGDPGKSVTSVTSKVITKDGKPCIRYYFYMDYSSTSYSCDVPYASSLEFDVEGYSIGGIDTVIGRNIDTVLQTMQTKIFNKVAAAEGGAATYYSVEDLKEAITGISDFDWYVKVGHFTDHYEIDGIRLGSTVYNADSTTTLSIGNNNFIQDKVYYIDEGNFDVYVAAPMLLELTDDVEDYELYGNFAVFNRTGEADAEMACVAITPYNSADTVKTATRFDYTSTPDQPAAPELTIASTGGVIYYNETLSYNDEIDTYNVTLKNGTTPIVINYDGKSEGDIIVTRITEGQNAPRYAIDTITSETQDFVGYTVGWLTGDDWASFTNSTRTYDITIYKTDGTRISTQFKTVSSKEKTTVNEEATVTAGLTFIKDNLYNKITNRSDGAKQVMTFAEAEAARSLSANTLRDNLMVYTLDIGAGKTIQNLTFASDYGDNSLGIIAEFTKNQTFEISIGNNVFIKSNAFTVSADGKVSISAALLGSLGSKCSLLIIDGEIVSLDQFMASTTTTFTLNSEHSTQNTVASYSEAGLTYCTAQIADTTEYIRFDNESLSDGDIIMIAEFSMDASGMSATLVSCGFDTYTTENGLFVYESYGKDADEVTPKTRMLLVNAGDAGAAMIVLSINQPSSDIDSGDGDGYSPDTPSYDPSEELGE